MPTQQRLHTHQKHDPHREKQLVALSSVGAALGLTAMKLLVGMFTGSLGILAEAAHSGLDLIAALRTLFAVRVSSRPADETVRNTINAPPPIEEMAKRFQTGMINISQKTTQCGAMGKSSTPKQGHEYSSKRS